MSSHRPSFWRVLSETSRIISAHSRHFLALSLLLLFPITLVMTVFPVLLQPTSAHSHYRRVLSYVSMPDSESKSQHSSQGHGFGLFEFLFELCAIAAITHSMLRVLYREPVQFTSSLESIQASFFPLLATVLVTKIILGVILSAVVVVMLVPYTGLASLGVNMDYGSTNFWVFVILIVALLIGLLTYLSVELYLTFVVVVAESEWGVAPLRRSWSLVKGMKWTVFWIILFFEILSFFLEICYSILMANAGGTNDGQIGRWVVLAMVVYAGFSTILSLYSLAAKTVVFAYCKAWHGELAFKIDEKLPGGYIQLSTDVVDAV